MSESSVYLVFRGYLKAMSLTTDLIPPVGSVKLALTPAPRVTEWSLLKDTYWIVYPEYTPAYELQGNSLGTLGLPKTDPPTITRVLDQTVYYIQDVDPRGYLWGYVAVTLVDPSWPGGAHAQSSYGTLLSPITPVGDWILSTTIDQGKALQEPNQTWATGKMAWMNVDGKDQWTMENWKVGGYVHWAYMVQAKPGDKYWDNLPIVGESIPEFLAPALAFAPVNPVPYLEATTSTAVRLIDNLTGFHLTTASATEASTLVGQGWRNEGASFVMGDAGIASAGNYKQVFRLFNSATRDHLLTTNTDEVSAANKIGYVTEGVVGRIQTASILGANTAVNRLYNGLEHLFSSSVVETNNLVAGGWRNEGVLGYVG